ncbi:MAG: glycine cleavage system protein R, partial [Pseudomonas aeruginosa]|nr:glycine cleavage system protein R [Pseudomonas aeruginosa]
QAPHTNTTMLNATITVTLPAGTQISWLRDQFLDFADALNLDALIEPWRPQHP